MEKCDYGCDMPYKFIFKNGKKCCSKSKNNCEGQKLKNSKGQKKLIPTWENGHPQGLLCSYGCGNVAKYLFNNGNMCCSYISNKCKGKSSKRTNHLTELNTCLTKLLNENYICDYGCGGIAYYVTKKGKKCCSESVNSCPERIKNNSDSKKGKKPKWKNGHPKGNKDKHKLKGKTWEEIYGKEKSERLKNEFKERLKLTGVIVSKEGKISQKEKARKNILERYANGWEVRCGRTKKIDYESPIAGKVKLDGTWELAAAKYFDSIGVQWIRNKKRFEYYNEINNTNSTYCPDFYIKDWGTYIEIKGYTTELDLCKWKQFNEKLEIWDKKKMKELKLI